MATVSLAGTAAARIQESLETQSRLLDHECLESISAATRLIVHALQTGGKIILFGNGGSAADAQHIAGEFLGRYLLERRSLPALTLADNAAALTAIANDFGYEHVFARMVEALAKPGDVVVGITTSGTSKNIVRGLEAAKRAGSGMTRRKAARMSRSFAGRVVRRSSSARPISSSV